MTSNENEIKLDVGCGPAPHEGYIGVDTIKYSEKIVKFNLEDIPKEKLPFENESIDEIICYHTLEHVDNPMQVVEEFYRILKPGKKLIIKVPYFAHNTANVPIHKNYWSFRSKMFFDSSYFETPMKWTSCKMSHKWGSSWKGFVINLPFEFLINLVGYDLYERFFCYMRPIFEITFEITK